MCMYIIAYIYIYICKSVEICTCEYANIRTCQCANVGMCKGNTGRICVYICKCILLTGDEWLCVGYQSDISTVDDVYEGRVVCVCANTFIDTSTQNLANVLSCNHHSQQVDFKLAFRLRIDSYSLASQTKVKSIQKTSAELGTTSTSAAKIPNITSALSFMRMAGLCSRESSTELL